MIAATKLLDNESLLNLTENSTEWINYYHRNNLNEEFLQYTDYYIRLIKNYKKVLIIEDDSTSFQILLRYIQDFDSEVKCFYASNLNDAKEIIETFHCDLIIADYFLNEDYNGLQICEEIRKTYPEIECVIVSSLKSYQFQEIVKYSSKELPFLEKPIHRNSLINILKNLLGRPCA